MKKPKELKVVRLTWEQFAREFKPVQNKGAIAAAARERRDVNNLDAVELYGFTPGGPGWWQVQRARPTRIWTETEADGFSSIGEGWHWVNYVRYYITRKSAKPGVQYIIAEQGEWCSDCGYEVLWEEAQRKPLLYTDEGKYCADCALRHKNEAGAA